jgi:hypothetical protein
MVFALVPWAEVESPCDHAVPGSAEAAIKPSVTIERNDFAEDCFEDCFNDSGARTIAGFILLSSRRELRPKKCKSHL